MENTVNLKSSIAWSDFKLNSDGMVPVIVQDYTLLARGKYIGAQELEKTMAQTSTARPLNMQLHSEQSHDAKVMVIKPMLKCNIKNWPQYFSCAVCPVAF